jgi:PPOX class probable F420-dependent enzyme
MTKMSKKEIRNFLRQGTLTGKLATVNKDGTPHVVPIWFVLDDYNNNDILLTTYQTSIKAKNIVRDSRVSICIDDQAPPFTFVTVHGNAEIKHYKKRRLLNWATKIAERYMGKKKAKVYGRRNSTEGSVLVRIRPTRIIAEKNVAD